ncbi:hypothetical protein JL721_2095 [Aureococcus anophagefferens]|nr:hypothetical protein JL721_2095 [Aureococcus anophagefferens]
MSQSQESQWFGPSQDESQCDEDVTNTFKALPAHSAFVRLSQDSSFNDAAPTLGRRVGASDGAAAAVPHAAAVVESESSSESSDDGREDSSGPAPHPSAGVFASLRAPASRPFLFRDDAVPRWAAGRRGGRVDAAVPLRVARTGDGTWDLAAGAPRRASGPRPWRRRRGRPWRSK